MPTSYTSLLGLALPVTGELSGTWGDTVNDYITQYLDSAVEGTQTISGSQTSVTLSVTNGTALTQVGSGSTGSAQYAIINCTGNPASTLTITAPASSRQYLVLNSTSTSQSVIFRGAGPTTGVTLVSGERCIVAWNGSDFVKIATSTADGVTTFSAGTTGFTPSSATSGAVTLAGTLATTNGGTGLTSFTANGVVYASSTSALTTGSALTFDGAEFGFTRSTAPFFRSTESSTGIVSYFGSYSVGLYFGTTSNHPVQFFVNSAEQMRLTSTGLGIGTSSPNYSVTAYKAGATATYLQVANGATGAGAANGLLLGVDTSGNGIINAQGAVNLNISVAGLQRATIDSSGNLGIGTSSPATKLQVGNGTGLQQAYISGGGYDLALGTSGGSLFGFASQAISGVFNTSSVPLGIGTNAAQPVVFGTANTERMRLDASGNLGLGVTPSAWNSGVKAFQLNATPAFWSFSNNLYLSNNRFFDTGGTNKYIVNGFATTYEQSSGQHIWLTAPSGTAGNAISFTQAMTLDASGNLLVGTTSSTPANANGLIAYGGTDAGILYLQRTTGTDQLRFYVGGNRLGYLNTASSAVTLGTANFPLVFATNDTERARIDTSGNFCIGSSSPGNAGTLNLSVGNPGTTTGGIQLWSTTTGSHYVQFGDSASGGAPYSGAIGYLHTSDAMLFLTNQAERARITSGGNVSIGGAADRGTTVGSAALQLFNGTAPAGTLTNGVSLYSQSGDLRFMDAAGNAYPVGFRNIPQSGSAKTGSYTLATTDVGEYIQVGSGGSITIPDATFATGDVVSVFNNTSGSVTITCSITTAYIAGTDSDKATMTLATRGVATILFISSTVCVVTGNVT